MDVADKSTFRARGPGPRRSSRSEATKRSDLLLNMRLQSPTPLLADEPTRNSKKRNSEVLQPDPLNGQSMALLAQLQTPIQQALGEVALQNTLSPPGYCTVVVRGTRSPFACSSVLASNGTCRQPGGKVEADSEHHFFREPSLCTTRSFCVRPFLAFPRAQASSSTIIWHRRTDFVEWSASRVQP
jgi:hypothetical protein